ncbi:MAG: hypothetical protein JST83_07360 [Bacteroidetes bacterium]|nr:hypothetical protein [Bacteroidota bacterium]
MNIRLCILSLCFGLALSGFSQAADDQKVSPSDLARARFQINDIRTRGIIVRLHTDLERLRALRSQGYTTTADQVEARNHVVNMFLCYAFITRYSFAPVYFMESQHTSQLMRDSLVALTWDLQRDTVIHMAHDTFYLVDYGQMLDNIPGKGNTTLSGNTPLAGTYLVTKGSDLQQLQDPLPFAAKVWGDQEMSTDILQPISIPSDLADSISACLHTFATSREMIRSDYKNALARYLMLIYDHVRIGIIPAGRQKPRPWSTAISEAADRYNEHFIEYYCKRLNKDKNIVSSESPIYWWLRNPNIRYLPYLRDLELRLKETLDTRERFTPTH